MNKKMIVKTLQQRIEEMSKRDKAPELEVGWNYYSVNYWTNKINKMYRNPNVSSNEKFLLTDELLKLWFSGNEKLCREIFGDIYGYYEKHDKKNIFATLTGDERELRVWLKPAFKPCGHQSILGNSHVDGFLENGLLHVNGLGNPIDKYISLIEEMIAPAFRMEYGGALFAKKREVLPTRYQTPSGYVKDIDYSNFKEIK